MIDGISALLAVAGFYLATLRLIWHGTKAIHKNHAYFFLFLCFLAWSLSTGLRSLILVWGYFGNYSLFDRYCFNGAVGLVLLIIGWPILKQFQNGNCFFHFPKFDSKEKWIILFVGLILILYCYRMILPWVDDDETGIYGYISKMISGGRTFSDMVREKVDIAFIRSQSQLVQCWDAQLYGVVNDTYLIRFNRLVNLLFCGAGLFAFLRIIRVRRLWSLVGVATFLSIPELSYLALSLKVDPVVMMFEWGAFLSIIMATACYWMERNSQPVLRVSFFLSVAALLLSAFAFGNRFSGITSMVLCSGFSLFFLIRLTKRPWVSFLSILILFVVFMLISAPGYWANYILFKNPVYPFKPFWPFGDGAYIFTMESFKSKWNIIGLSPVILQIYLVFALGSGLELLAKAMPFLNHLPMAAMRTTSMGWPYPIIFGIFLWPFFMRANRVLNLIVSIFIFQFVCWSLGLHYSRLFVASCSLMILAVVMMIDQAVAPKDIARKRAQQILKVLVMVGLVAAFLLQAWWFAKRYYGPCLFSPQQRYQEKVNFLKGNCHEENILTFSEERMLDAFFLRKHSKPLVYAITYDPNNIHILFDKRIYIKELGTSSPFIEPGTYLLINPFYSKSKSSEEKILLRYFPVHVLTTPQTKWEVYTDANGL